MVTAEDDTAIVCLNANGYTDGGRRSAARRKYTPDVYMCLFRRRNDVLNLAYVGLGQISLHKTDFKRASTIILC